MSMNVKLTGVKTNPSTGVKEEVTNSLGDPAGLVEGSVSIHQEAGALETRDVTIDGAADLFTDPTAPVAAELITVTGITAGKKRCRITWHCLPLSYVQGATSDTPIAAFCVATINAGDDTTALLRLTLVNTGVGDLSTDTRKRMVSAQNPSIEWDLTKTDSTIDRIDIGAIPPADVGQIPVYLSVEVW